MEKEEKRLNANALEKLGLRQEDLIPATAEEKAASDQMRPSVGYWKDAMQRFRRNKLAMVMLSRQLPVTLDSWPPTGWTLWARICPRG